MSALRITAVAHGAIEDGDRSEFHLSIEQALLVLEKHGDAGFSFPELFRGRGAILRAVKTKENVKRVIAEVPAKEDDPGAISGWLPKKSRWAKLSTATTSENDVDLLTACDEQARHICIDATGSEWVINSKEGWKREPLRVVEKFLGAKGYDSSQIDYLIGLCADNPWQLVNIPFAPEFPGDRQWNKTAVQHRFKPGTGKHPTWDSVFHHCGQDLDEALGNLLWAQQANIRTGRDYLLTWGACLLRDPYCKLPYLFLFSEDEDTGKTTLGKAIARLITVGAVSGDRALRSEFNGELENAILCVVEETDLSVSGSAVYSRLKSLVTDDVLPIRRMRTDQYQVKNCTHWIQSANSRSFCPLGFGDSRITICRVPPLTSVIEPRTLFARLDEEGPALMRTILDLDLPPATGRLRLPVVFNDTKHQAAKATVSDFIIAVVDRVESLGEVVAACRDFAKLFGNGRWPENVPQVRHHVEKYSAYLRHHGVGFDVAVNGKKAARVAFRKLA